MQHLVRSPQNYLKWSNYIGSGGVWKKNLSAVTLLAGSEDTKYGGHIARIVVGSCSDPQVTQVMSSWLNTLAGRSFALSVELAVESGALNDGQLFLLDNGPGGNFTGGIGRLDITSLTTEFRRMTLFHTFSSSAVSSNYMTARIDPGQTVVSTITVLARGAVVVEVASGSAFPLTMTNSQHNAGPIDFITIDPINYDRSDELIQNTHRMKSGAGFRYIWGRQNKAKFGAMVDSSTAAIVNSWWQSNAPVYAVQSDGTSDVGTCYITNKSSPFASFKMGNNTLWTGTIELEGF